MKPYEKLKKSIEENPNVTDGNRQGLLDFLEDEHPGDVLFTKWDYPQIIKAGKGNKIWDVDGKEYIDCISGMSTMNIGHGDPRIAEVLKNQYLELDNWFDFPTPERIKLVKKLKEITPGDYKKRVRLALSGSDAVEIAIRTAKYYTKKTHVISFYGAYHGETAATMGLTAAGGMHRWFNPAQQADSCLERFPYAYCYRCPYDKEYGSCNMHCVKVIDDLMSSGQTSLGNPFSGVCNVACMIVEPMQSSAGYIAPPVEFLAELRKLADKYGFLLIFDEIQTGLGRSGKMFAAEYSGVAPDITLVGKALGAGVPMSAVVGRAEIFEDAAPGFVVSTYAGGSLGCAVGNKVIEIIEEDKYVENSFIMGEYLKKKLDEYMEAHKLVGTYSQRGLYFGIEYVSDRTTKEPAVKQTAALVNALRDAGLLCQLNGYYNNRLSFIPPINIKEKEIDEIFEVLNKVTGEVEKSFE